MPVAEPVTDTRRLGAGIVIGSHTPGEFGRAYLAVDVFVGVEFFQIGLVSQCEVEECPVGPACLPRPLVITIGMLLNVWWVWQEDWWVVPLALRGRAPGVVANIAQVHGIVQK